MKFKSKTDFLNRCDAEWTGLWQLVETFDATRLVHRGAPRGSKTDPPRSIKDHLAHLHCWHRLLLGWRKSGERGDTPSMPATGYNWAQTRQLNHELFEEFRDVPFATVKRKLKLSHGRVMKWVSELSQRDLLVPGRFAWTGKHALSSYIAPNTVSHYRWAQKKIGKMTSG